jgi:oligopeptide/dipeptide ABC transporter ATP-binding protein
MSDTLNGASVMTSLGTLTVDNLAVHFPLKSRVFGRRQGAVRAVDGVSFSVGRREVFGVVGESGSGKSTLGRAILRLVDISDGSIRLGDKDLAKLKGRELRGVRSSMQMVFQDPMASLDPRKTIGQSIVEPLAVRGVDKHQMEKRLNELLDMVRLSRQVRHRYPHQLSGGQCQRAVIARAVSAEPQLLICDEPTAALDASIRAQVINVLIDLHRDLDLSIIFIAHDLNLVRHMSDRVAVMNLGVIVELGDADPVFANPLHPYTRALVSSTPLADPTAERQRKRIILRTDMPSPANPPSGCRFRTRCPIAQDRCAAEVPELREVLPGRLVACHFAEQVPQRVPIAARGGTP